MFFHTKRHISFWDTSFLCGYTWGRKCWSCVEAVKLKYELLREKQRKWKALYSQHKRKTVSFFYFLGLDKTRANNLISLINIWQWHLSLITGSTAAMKWKMSFAKIQVDCTEVCKTKKKYIICSFWNCWHLSSSFWFLKAMHR